MICFTVTIIAITPLTLKYDVEASTDTQHATHTYTIHTHTHTHRIIHYTVPSSSSKTVLERRGNLAALPYVPVNSGDAGRGLSAPYRRAQ